MRNITNFDKFKNIKKLNEEADPRAGSYGGGGDTYFANVKGNFAGAENTLIGSAVMKIFGFFKRKINEGVLFLYKKALFREYLANVLRYAAKNGIKAVDENAMYSVQQISNAEGATIKEPVVIKVKFTNENKSLLSPYTEGSKVINEKGKSVEDGTYQKVEDEKPSQSFFIVENGIIKTTFQMDPEVKTPEAEKEPQTQPASDEKKDNKYSDIGNDLKLLKKEIDDIIKNINGLSDQEQLEKLSEKKTDIVKIKTMVNTSITKVKKEVNTIKEQDKKDKLAYLIGMYNIELEYLKELETSITNAIAKISKKSTEPVEPEKKKVDLLSAAPPPTLSDEERAAHEEKKKKETEEAIATGKVVKDNMNYETDDVLNEEFKKISKGISFRGIKLGGVDKKLADEVGNLDMSVLESEEFAKNFENEEVKKAVTNTVLENKAPIIKIQLAAERMYKIAQPSPATQKLENTWKRMVNDDKALFSRYMLIDQVDPFVLVNSADGQKIATDIKEKKDKNDQENKVRSSLINFNLTNNKVLKLSKTGWNDDENTYGIVETSEYGYLLFFQQKVKIGEVTYWVYKIVGVIEDAKKLSEVVDESTIKENVKVDFKSISRMMKSDATKNITFASRTINGIYKGAYIIGNESKKHINSSKTTDYANNKVNVVSLYNKSDNLVPLEQSKNTFDYFFTCKNNIKDNKDVQLASNPSNAVKNWVTPFSVREVFRIPVGTEVLFGVKDDSKKPLPTDLGNIEFIKGLKGSVT